KQLVFINIIILVIFISVVRMGIKKENIAHARFIEESMHIQNIEDQVGNFTVSRNYHDFTISLGDIKHPPRFTNNNSTNSDEVEETIEIEDDVEEEDELMADDQVINNEDTSINTEGYSEASNDSANRQNSAEQVDEGEGGN